MRPISLEDFASARFAHDYQYYTGAFVPYDFSLTVVNEVFTAPTWGDITNTTPMASDPGLDDALFISVGDSETLTALAFCSSKNNSSLTDFATDSLITGDTVTWDDTNSVRTTTTNSMSYEYITCASSFDHNTFQSQQLFDIKYILLSLTITVIFYVGVKLLKSFILSTNQDD